MASEISAQVTGRDCTETAQMTTGADCVEPRHTASETSAEVTAGGDCTVPSSGVDVSSCSTILTYYPPRLSKFLDVDSAEKKDNDDTDNGHSDDNDSDDRQGVIVASTSNKTAGNRVWDKRYYCLYCEMAVCQLPRYLYSAHANELAVAEIISADKDQNLALSTKVRNLGNKQHNHGVLSSVSGDLAVVMTHTSLFLNTFHVNIAMATLISINCGSCKMCRCKPDIIQSSSHPVAAGDLLLPHKSDDSTVQLLRGMKKGMEFSR